MAAGRGSYADVDETDEASGVLWSFDIAAWSLVFWGALASAWFFLDLCEKEHTTYCTVHAIRMGKKAFRCIHLNWRA